MKLKEVTKNSIGYGVIVGAFVSLVCFFFVYLPMYFIDFDYVGGNIYRVFFLTLIVFLMFSIPVFIISFIMIILIAYFFK